MHVNGIPEAVDTAQLENKKPYYEVHLVLIFDNNIHLLLVLENDRKAFPRVKG